MWEVTPKKLKMVLGMVTIMHKFSFLFFSFWYFSEYSKFSTISLEFYYQKKRALENKGRVRCMRNLKTVQQLGSEGQQRGRHVTDDAKEKKENRLSVKQQQSQVEEEGVRRTWK